MTSPVILLCQYNSRNNLLNTGHDPNKDHTTHFTSSYIRSLIKVLLFLSSLCKYYIYVNCCVFRGDKLLSNYLLQLPCLGVILLIDLLTDLVENMITWWSHDMETLSILLGYGKGNPTSTSEFPSQRDSNYIFDDFVDVTPNKLLNK